MALPLSIVTLRARSARRRSAIALAMLAFALPAPADAITLDALLAQPLECLLRLTVTPACPAGRACQPPAGEPGA